MRNSENIRRKLDQSRFFLLLGLGFSPDYPMLPRNQAHWPPRVVCSLNQYMAEIRPVLVLGHPETSFRPRRHYSWMWSQCGRLLLVFRKRNNLGIVARRIADALESLFAVFHGTAAPNSFVPYRVPEGVLKAQALLQKDMELVEPAPNRNVGRTWNFHEWFQSGLTDRVTVSERVMAHVFFHLPTVLGVQALFDATHFYKEALRDYAFVGDEITEILNDQLGGADSESDRLRLENAVLHCFRAVEALVGEPGHNEKRFRGRLQALGIDPNEDVGYPGGLEGPISERIRWLQVLRDSTAAHGRRRRRTPLTFLETMEAEHLAWAVVIRAVVLATASRGRSDGTLAERRYLLSRMYGHQNLTYLRKRLDNARLEVFVGRPRGLKAILDILMEQTV